MPRYRIQHRYPCYPGCGCIPYDGYFVQVLQEGFFTDKGDVVIDPCAGSGTTLLAAMNTMRRAYGFEIKKDFYKDAKEKVLRCGELKLF